MQRRVIASATLVGVVASVITLGAAPAAAAPPALALSAPVDGSSSTDTTPEFSGATDCTIGACSDITVELYSGSSATGTPVQTLTAAKAANWTTTAVGLGDGTYTAIASQDRSGRHGGTTVTSPTTFMIDTSGPVVTLVSAPASVDEGSTASFSYSIDDGQGVGGSSVVVACGSVTPGNVSNTATAGSFDCTYPDGPSSETVTITATDALGNAGAQVSTSVSIANVKPQTTFIDGGLSLSEGGSGTYEFSFSDPGQDTIQDAIVSCGTGNLSSKSFDGSGVTFDCTFADSGTPSVTASVVDSDGDEGNTASATIAVGNVAPTTTFASGPASLDEGQTGSYSFLFGDPGQDTIQDAIVSCGTGTVSNKSFDDSGVTFDCAFADSGTPSVSASAVDSDGDEGNTASVNVDVANVAPTTTVESGPGARDEGESGTYSFTFTEPGQDTIQDAIVSCGTGTVSNKSFDDSGVTFDCTFTASGTTAVTASAVDSDGSAGDSAVQSVDVANVAPTATFASGPATLELGQTGTYSFSLADPGQDSVGDVDISCGSGLPSAESFDDSGVTFDCTFLVAGTTTVSASATDSDNAAGDPASTNVEVTVPPEPEPEPTEEPSPEPTPEPTNDPTPEPTNDPTPEPTVEPSAAPTHEPAADPSPGPAPDPSVDGNAEPDTGNSTGGAVTGWPVPEGEVTLDTDVISPNDDGDFDSVTITARFSEPVWWTFELLDEDDVLLTKSGFGFSFEHVWDGTVAGDVVPNGEYDWRVTAHSGYVSMAPVSGSLSVDADAPDFMQVTVAKGGRTAASIDVVVSEDSDIVVSIRRGKRIVRTMSRNAKAGRATTVKWDGRNSEGRRLRPGRYHVMVHATDAAGNVSTAPLRTIRL